MPRKAVDGGARLHSLNLKTTKELRDRLEAAAALSGRPLTYEVEARINRSFDFDYLLGDSETALALRAIGNAILRFEKETGKSWAKDSATQERSYEAASRMLEVMMKPSSLTDDRIDRSEMPGLPVNLHDPYMRAGFQNRALDIAIEELQSYRKQKEQDAKKLRPPPNISRAKEKI